MIFANQKTEIFEISFNKALTHVKQGDSLRHIFRKVIYMKADVFYRNLTAWHKQELINAKRSRHDKYATLNALFSK